MASSSESSGDELVRAAAEAKSRYGGGADAAHAGHASSSRESSEFRVVTRHEKQQARTTMKTTTSFESDSDSSSGAESDDRPGQVRSSIRTTERTVRSYRGDNGDNHRSGSADSSFVRDLIERNGGGTNDSRSIVLALRALQEKIRKLEADRDFHREQCEQARRAHEAYKADVEEQLHRDRRDFRKRESDLQDLIARAKQEQQRLHKTLDDTRNDASAVGGETVVMLDRERREAEGRHVRLREELDQYRRQVAEERLEVEKSRQAADHARAERDILEATNRRLEHTVKDLLSMNKSLVRRAGDTAAAAVADSSSGRHAQNHNTSARHADPNASAGLHAGGQRRSSSASASGLHQPPMRFQSPTLASIQHRARRTTTATAAVHDFSRDASYQGGRAFDAASYGVRTRTSSGARPSAHQSGHASSRVGGTTRRSGSAGFRANGQASAAAEPLDAVYTALEAELRALNKKYKQVIDEANGSDAAAAMSPEVLTARLNGIMVQIDRKSEQLRLLRATKASAATEDVRGRPVPAKGFAKATHKVQQMNALRRLAHEHDNP